MDQKLIIDKLRDNYYIDSNNARDKLTKKDLGEYYTPPDLINKMLDGLDESLFSNPFITFLDPACGNGQILSEIVIRKIQKGISFSQALNTVKGIDINPDSVEECKTRLSLGNSYDRIILDSRIICEDSLTYKCDDIDVFITNPPYRGKKRLHQKFFNKAVEQVKDNGVVCFIQPAVAYFNKNANIDQFTQLMKNNVKKYSSSVEILKSNVFPHATNQTALCITWLTKKPSDVALEEIRYFGGAKFSLVQDINTIHQLPIDPKINKSIETKYKALVEKQGSLSSLIVKDSKELIARLSRIRGHGLGSPDYFTFTSKEKRYNTYYGSFGIKAKTEEEAEYIFSYLETKMARYGLSLCKFNQHITTVSALSLTPLVPFTKKYTDQELYEMLELTEKEIETIETNIGEYYK